MKGLDFLEQVDHNGKAAIYAAAHDGKMRNFAYHEGLGECRETFSRLLHAVQEGEIGVLLTPDAACLAIETSPGWMEAFIQVVKQHGVLIGDHSHGLVYDLREEEDEVQFRALYSQGAYEKERSAPRPLVDAIAQSPFAAASITRFEGVDPDAPIYSLSSGAIGQDVDMLMLGHWREILDILAPYGISVEGGWCPVPPERRDWLSRTQQQEEAMATQSAAAMKPHRADVFRLGEGKDNGSNVLPQFGRHHARLDHGHTDVLPGDPPFAGTQRTHPRPIWKNDSSRRVCGR